MRSVENKLTTIPLGTGMNESAGKRSGTAAIYVAQNCRLRSAGSLQKRCGTRSLSGETSTPPNAKALASTTTRPTGEHPMFIGSINGELVFAGTDAGDAFRYSDEIGKWKYHGSFSTSTPTGSATVIPTQDFPTGVDGSLAGIKPAAAMNAAGYMCFAVGLTGRLIKIVVQDPDGAQIAAATIGPLTGNPTKVQVINTNVTVGATVTDGFVILFDGAGAGSDLNGYQVSIAAGVAVIGGSFSGVTVGSNWDAARYSASMWALAYRSGGTTVVATVVTTTSSTITSIATPAVTDPVSVYGDTVNSRIWLGYAGGGTVNAKVYQTDGTLQSTVSIAAGVSSASPPLFGPAYGVTNPTPTKVVFVYSATIASAYGSTPSARYTYYGTSDTGGGVTAYGSIAHAIPVSKPYGRHEVWLAVSRAAASGFTPTRYILVRMQDIGETTTGTPVNPIQLATPELENMGNYHPDLDIGRGGLAVATDGAGNYAMSLAIPVTSQSLSATTQESLLQARIYRYSFGGHRDIGDVGDGMMLSGQPVIASPISRRSDSTDSAGMVEVGFPHEPAIYSLTASSVGSGSIAIGSYAYVAVAWWSDEFGRLHESAPSLPVVIALTQTSNVDVVVAKPRGFGCRVISDPIIKLYRTVAGGVNYQLVPESGAEESGNPGLVIFTDNQPDSIVAAEGFVYTDGGVLPNKLAPSCQFTATAEDRLWCGGLWDPTILEASKVRIPGEPTNFTGDATHQVVLPEACTGLAYQDGQVVAFAESSIYLVGGDGPNDQGAGTFLPPRALVRGIGCINYKSIVETQIGIFFQSNAGIYLIPRGFGSPQYVGNPVMDTITNKPTILSAAMTRTEEFSTVRFLLADSVGGAYGSSVLVFDIDVGQWFLDTYSVTDTSFVEIGSGPNGALLARYALTSAIDPVWVEDETHFLDDGALDLAGAGGFIARTVQTTWIYPFGAAGWGRANKAVLSMSHDYPSGTDTDSQDVTLTIEVDAPDPSTTTGTWTVNGSLSSDASYRGFDITSRDSTAIRATITDVVDVSEDVRGPKLVSLTLESDNGGGIRMLTPSER